MKKTKLFQLCGLATLVLLNPLSALANENSSNVTTKGSVNLTKPDAANNIPTKPINPDNPNNPSEYPTPDPNGGGNGLLRIDYAPKSLDFKTSEIPTVDTVLYAKPIDAKDSAGNVVETWTNYVQVTDKRATYTGWQLTVKQEAQFKNVSATKNNELTGAKISLGTQAAPAQIVGANISSEYSPSTVRTQTVLTPGEVSTVVRANSEEGFGTWLYKFGDASTKEQGISLEIKGNGMYAAGSYTSELTWSITDVPQGA